MLQHKSVTITDVEASAKRLAGIVHCTPVLTSRTVNDRTAAALLEGVVTAPQNRIGVIISGGNVDFAQIGQLSMKKQGSGE